MQQITLNQYVAGVASYSDVILARALVTATLDRQTAAISLIQAIGGYWEGDAAVASSQ